MRSLVRKFRRFACHLQVTIVYTAPTAIRSLMAKGNDVVKKASRKSLRILGTVGEPINVEAWKWYHEVGLPYPVYQNGVASFKRWSDFEPSIFIIADHLAPAAGCNLREE